MGNVRDKEIPSKKEGLAGTDAIDDEVQRDIDEVKSMIEEMLWKYTNLNPEEKLIMERIRDALKNHRLKFSYDPEDPRHVDLVFRMEDHKTAQMNILLQDGKVIFRMIFPFRVQTNAIPLMSMYMAEYNSDKAFGQMKLDPDDGELSMEYSYVLEKIHRFDKKQFGIYMMSLVKPTKDIYSEVSNLSRGIVSGRNKRLYKILLQKALETINGDYDDDNVTYGLDGLQIVPFAMGGKRFPTFEELLRMRYAEDAESDAEDEDHGNTQSSEAGEKAAEDEDE